jgi:hypothetical protein
MLHRMRAISYLLDATIALVFIFGVLGALLTGSRTGSRRLARRSAAQSGLTDAQAWVSGFGGSMGWDGAAPPRAAEEEA